MAVAIVCIRIVLLLCRNNNKWNNRATNLAFIKNITYVNESEWRAWVFSSVNTNENIEVVVNSQNSHDWAKKLVKMFILTRWKPLNLLRTSWKECLHETFFEIKRFQSCKTLFIPRIISFIFKGDCVLSLGWRRSNVVEV